MKSCTWITTQHLFFVCLFFKALVASLRIESDQCFAHSLARLSKFILVQITSSIVLLLVTLAIAAILNYRVGGWCGISDFLSGKSNLR